MKRLMLLAAMIMATGFALAQSVDPPKIAPPVTQAGVGGMGDLVTPKPPPDGSPIKDRAECRCQDQCEAMWAAVPEGLESASRMRVRIASDSFAETYAPFRGQFGVLAGRATKRPDGHGGYSIRGDFSSRYGEADEEQRAARLFYLIVNEAAIGIRCPAT